MCVDEITCSIHQKRLSFQNVIRKYFRVKVLIFVRKRTRTAKIFIFDSVSCIFVIWGCLSVNPFGTIFITKKINQTRMLCLKNRWIYVADLTGRENLIGRKKQRIKRICVDFDKRLIDWYKYLIMTFSKTFLLKIIYYFVCWL